MGIRITQQTTVRSAIYQLNLKQMELARLQEQLGTLRRINRPSDDPAGNARCLSTKTQLDQIARFGRNISSIKDRLDVSASTLQGVSDLLLSAKQIVLSASNSAVSQSERTVMASQIEDIIHSVVQIANSKHQNRYLFAGSATATEPFELTDLASPTPVAYKGNDASAQQYIDFRTKIETSIVGSTVFGVGTSGDVFAVLSSVRRLLLNSDGLSEKEQLEQLSEITGELAAAQDRVLSTIGSLGGRSATLEATALRLEDEAIVLEKLVSEAEDADLAELISRFADQQNALQAALMAAADIIRPTLVQALR